MSDRPITKRQKLVRTHNFATLVALLSFVGIVLGAVGVEALALPASIAFVFAMFVAILVMFRTRNADEYTAAVWRAATSLAFVITAGVMLLTPIVEGVYDGYMQAHTGRRTERDLTLDGFVVVIAAFFTGNAWARLRGTA